MIVLGEKKEKRKPNLPYEEELEQRYVKTERELPLRGSFRQRAGEPLCLTVSAEVRHIGTVSAEVMGAVAERARTAGSSPEAVRERLLKTGGTGFRFSELAVSMEEGYFFPVKQLNELRRQALEAISATIDSRFARKTVRPTKTVCDGETGDESSAVFEGQTEDKPPAIHVSCDSEEQLKVVSAMPEVSMISFGSDSLPPERWEAAISEIHGSGKQAYLLLPQIFRTEAEQFFTAQAELLANLPFDALIVRNLEEPGYFRKLYESRGKLCPSLLFDFQVYGMNREAQRCLKGFGAARLTLPIEETARELRALETRGQELVVAGRLPMMVSANCVKKTAARCDHKAEYMQLRDRRMMDMPVRTHCTFCYNTIYNAAPLSLSGVAGELRELKLGAVRLLLTNENAEQSRAAVRSLHHSFVLGERDVAEAYENFTRGHFRKGVE